MGEKGQDAQKGPQEPGVDGGKVQLPGACTQCGLRCSGEMCAAPQRVGRRRTAALSATQLFHASPGLGPGAITPEAHRKRARRLQTLEHTPRSAGAGEDLAAESGSWGRRGAGWRGAGRQGAAQGGAHSGKSRPAPYRAIQDDVSELSEKGKN